MFARLIACCAAALALSQSPATAAAQVPSPEALIGQWQGVLHSNRDLRIVLKFSKDASGAVSGKAYSIDQVGPGLPVSGIAVQGTSIKFAYSIGRYEGTLSPDGKTLKGAFTSGYSVPLDYVRTTPATAWAIPFPDEDKYPHKVQFVTVDKGVDLEVLDWGGQGRPLLLFAGLGTDAHIFDKFAVALAKTYRVYGVTRRGFGASGKPAPMYENYSTERLGDDGLAVMDALKLERPILVGFSMGGAEMSSIASRHPERVAGLVYLDAGYNFAYYAPASVAPAYYNLMADANDLRKRIDRLFKGGIPPQQQVAALDELLRVNLAELQTDLQTMKAYLQQPAPAYGMSMVTPPTPDQKRYADAVNGGTEKFTDLKRTPILSFYMTDHLDAPGSPQSFIDGARLKDKEAEIYIRKFEQGNPQARVVRMPNADHAMFHSDEAWVLREMDAFIKTLP